MHQTSRKKSVERPEGLGPTLLKTRDSGGHELLRVMGLLGLWSCDTDIDRSFSAGELIP